MKITTLEHTVFSEIMDCFLASFADYYVPMPKDHNYYKKRWETAGLNYHLSYGVFDDDVLVAFALHAVDVRAGDKTAFNTGTGVLANYRGQRLVQQLYEFALDDFKKQGIKKITLEVIQENRKAIRAYQKVGFSIERELLCYKASIGNTKMDKLKLKAVDIASVDWQQLPDQSEYSWDFQMETLVKSAYHFYYVMKDDIAIAYFIVDLNHKMIAQFDLLVDDQKQWINVFAGIATLAQEFRLNNLCAKRFDKRRQLSLYGFSNTINQYEMCYNLT